MWTSRCGRKASISPTAASGEAAPTSRPGRLRWIERAMAWRYMRGERATSTRIMSTGVPLPSLSRAPTKRWVERCRQPPFPILTRQGSVARYPTVALGRKPAVGLALVRPPRTEIPWLFARERRQVTLSLPPLVLPPIVRP